MSARPVGLLTLLVLLAALGGLVAALWAVQPRHREVRLPRVTEQVSYHEFRVSGAAVPVLVLTGQGSGDAFVARSRWGAVVWCVRSQVFQDTIGNRWDLKGRPWRGQPSREPLDRIGAERDVEDVIVRPSDRTRGQTAVGTDDFAGPPTGPWEGCRERIAPD